MRDHFANGLDRQPPESGSPEDFLAQLASRPLDVGATALLQSALADAHNAMRSSLDCVPALAGTLADAARVSRMTSAHERYFIDALIGADGLGHLEAAAEAGALHYHRGIDLGTMIAAHAVLLTRLLDNVGQAGGETHPARLQKVLLARGFLSLLHFSAGYLRAMRDDHHEVTEQLRDLAYRDPLTGLANRRLFTEQLNSALRTAPRLGHRVGLLRLDVDYFKALNDSFGHDAGDAVLAELAHRLRSCVRDMDLPARIGGDEFAVLLPAVPTADHLAQIAERILKAARVPVVWAGQAIEFGISIGGALSVDQIDGEQLLCTADRALYEVKASGGCRYAYSEAKPGSSSSYGILSDFARALEKGTLYFCYQPQIDLASRTTIGVEALLRSGCPRLARMPPNELMRVVERSSLVHRFTDVMLQCVGNDMRKVAAKTGFRGIVSVNLSEAQLRGPGSLPAVLRLAAELVPLGMHLELEITEGAFGGDDAERIFQMLQGLRSRGIMLALDDFGTGYASLAHLRRVPVDRLKIDRQFIAEMTDSSMARHIVKAVLRLARHLPAAVVAEGIETREQVELLRRFGCEAGQGYYFAPPLRPDELSEFLHRGFRAPAADSPRIASPRPFTPVGVGDASVGRRQV